MTGLIILIFGATIFYLNIKLRQANETIEELRSILIDRPGEHLVTVRPGAFERFVEAIGHLPPPPSPDHYSVGGTKPHMCVCGKPIKEHQ